MDIQELKQLTGPRWTANHALTTFSRPNFPPRMSWPRPPF